MTASRLDRMLGNYWPLHSVYQSQADRNTERKACQLGNIVMFDRRWDGLHSSIPEPLKVVTDWVECREQMDQLMNCLRTPYFFEEYLDLPPGTATQHHPYAELPGDRYIRLLRLFPSEHSFTAIRCSSIIVSIDSTPPYEAMSWTWGPPADSGNLIRSSTPVRRHREYAEGRHEREEGRMMWLDGLRFEIRPNLFDNLNSLRAGQMTCRLLWVDAVCINQNNIRERTSQITLMRTIFSEADQVTIFTGKAVDRDTLGRKTPISAG